MDTFAVKETGKGKHDAPLDGFCFSRTHEGLMCLELAAGVANHPSLLYGTNPLKKAWYQIV